MIATFGRFKKPILRCARLRWGYGLDDRVIAALTASCAIIIVPAIAFRCRFSRGDYMRLTLIAR